MKLIVSTFLVYKVKKCLLKSGKVRFFFCWLPMIFFCLPTEKFLPAQGKIKVGRAMVFSP